MAVRKLGKLVRLRQQLRSDLETERQAAWLGCPSGWLLLPLLLLIWLAILVLGVGQCLLSWRPFR